MNGSNLLLAPLACALSLALVAQGCREDLGCPPGTLRVGDVCEDAPDAGIRPDGSTAEDSGADDACAEALFYADLDADGLGAGEGVRACVAPEGYVANADDCDDTCDVCGHGVEACDGKDNDCDGEVDENCRCDANDTRPCGIDTGECSLGVQTCNAAGVYGDCEGDVGPAVERCNGKDDDCDGVIDNGNPGGGASCGTDTGECAAGMEMCVGGVVGCVGAIVPVPEVCNGKDDDCTGASDEGVTTRYYRDADGDSRGEPTMFLDACAAPSGYVSNANDCDDTCAACWTGNAELCDGRDNDCTGAVDDPFTCSVGATVPCMTACGTTGTGSCTSMCMVPGAAACQAPAETCNGVDEDCNGLVDEGVRIFGSFPPAALGSAAQLAGAGSGYVGIIQYNGQARVYATDATGVVTQAATTVDASNVTSVDITRISDTQWITATGFANAGVNVRLIGLSSGALVTQDVELANSTNGGLARVAANSATDAMTVFHSGSTVRVAHVDFQGALAGSVALPGSNPRAELGMDIASLGLNQGFVVTWVSGLSPVVNIALVSAPGMTVSSSGTLGAGSNPTVAVNASGRIGVAYAGADGRPRLHVLRGDLTCVGPDSRPRSACAFATSDRIVATPVGAGTFDNTLDLAATGSADVFWLAARTTEGELLQRSGGSATTRYDDIFRNATATSWVRLAASGETPIMLRGSGTAFTHLTLGCAP